MSYGVSHTYEQFKFGAEYYDVSCTVYGTYNAPEPDVGYSSGWYSDIYVKDLEAVLTGEGESKVDMSEDMVEAFEELVDAEGEHFAEVLQGDE